MPSSPRQPADAANQAWRPGLMAFGGPFQTQRPLGGFQKAAERRLGGGEGESELWMWQKIFIYNFINLLDLFASLLALRQLSWKVLTEPLPLGAASHVPLRGPVEGLYLGIYSISPFF